MNIKVIDNFLEEEDFKELNSIKLKDIKKNEIFIHHNKISGEKIIENTCLSKKLLARLNQNYHKKTLRLHLLYCLDFLHCGLHQQ